MHSLPSWPRRQRPSLQNATLNLNSAANTQIRTPLGRRASRLQSRSGRDPRLQRPRSLPPPVKLALVCRHLDLRSTYGYGTIRLLEEKLSVSVGMSIFNKQSEYLRSQRPGTESRVPTLEVLALE